MEIIDKSFIKAPKSYVKQSLLATLVVFIILFFFTSFTDILIVAALGASTFIVFAMPHSITAEPRRLIGGHAVGLISGTICYYTYLNLATDVEFIFCIACALSVGLAIFLMTITNTEHPPAAATALSVVTFGWSYQVVIFVLSCAICLAVARRLLRSHLRDLF
jgi:CBS-domain-containing membrane protein